MAEGQQAGIAEQQIEPEQRNGVAEKWDHQADVICRQNERQQCKRRSPRYSDHKGGLHASDLPNRPAGRKIKTPITMT